MKLIDADRLMETLESVPYPDYLSVDAVRFAISLAPTVKVDKDELIDIKTVIDVIMTQPPEPHYPIWYAMLFKELQAQRKEIVNEHKERHDNADDL